jgi:hypothetical protein
MGGMRGRRGVRKTFWRLQMVMWRWWEVDRAVEKKVEEGGDGGGE